MADRVVLRQTAAKPEKKRGALLVEDLYRLEIDGVTGRQVVADSASLTLEPVLVVLAVQVTVDTDRNPSGFDQARRLGHSPVGEARRIVDQRQLPYAAEASTRLQGASDGRSRPLSEMRIDRRRSIPGFRYHICVAS